jgi:hypothetical protein
MSELSSERIQAALGSAQHGPFGARVYYYDQIHSTNDVARELASQGLPEGTLVIADEQTAGRGREPHLDGPSRNQLTDVDPVSTYSSTSGCVPAGDGRRVGLCGCV